MNYNKDMSKKKSAKKDELQYTEFLISVNENLINLYNDLQNSREKIYNRAIGTTTFVLTILGLSFIKYDNLNFYNLANENLGLLIAIVILMVSICIFLIILFTYFIKTIYTRKRSIIGYNYYTDNFKSISDFNKYDEDDLILSLNKAYDQPLNELKQYIDKIQMYFSNMIIYSIILLFLSVANFVTSLFL